MNKTTKAALRRKELSAAARKRAEDEDWVEWRASATLPPAHTTLKVALRRVFGMAQEMTGAMMPEEMDDWREWLTMLEKHVLAMKELKGYVVKRSKMQRAARTEGR